MNKKKIYKRFIGIAIVMLLSVLFIHVFGLNDNENQITIIEDKAACIIVKYVTSDSEKLVFEGIKARKMLTENMELIELQTPAAMEKYILDIENLSTIEFAQPNYVLKADTIDDESYYQQWGLKNNTKNMIDINAEAAWEIKKGTDAVTIGVLDTAIDTEHYDLDGVIKGNGYNFITNNNETTKEILDKHGTAIAGIIAAKSDKNGIRGVASGVKITPLQFMQNYSGYTSDAIRAIKYAEEKNIDIINCSFGCNEFNPALKTIMESSNILFVCSAGNDGCNIDQTPYYPACFELPNILSVGSINKEGQISAFSNFGQNVDILAPGEDIYSLMPENGYYSYGGTSMSAAYVTGVAALLKSQENDITPHEMVERIINTARKYPDYVEKTKSGGFVDAHAALVNESAPFSEMSLFYDADETEQLREELLEEDEITSLAAVNDISAVSTVGEIEPIVAQRVHYGESGVNPASGNFSFSVVDFDDPAPGGNFIFKRYYNSLDQADAKAFGRGWSSIFDAHVYKDQDITVTMPNGSSNVFKLENNKYTSITTRNILFEDGNQYTLKTPEQEEYTFVQSAAKAFFVLTQIKDKTGSTVVQIVYTDDSYSMVSHLLDSAGRRYTVEYGVALTIKSITDPYGRVVRYNCEQHQSKQYEINGETVTGDPLVLLRSWTDILGNTMMVSFIQKDQLFMIDTNYYPYTDTFVDSIFLKDASGKDTTVILINYNIKSYDPDYGKVMSYTDAYLETYTYDYNYMKTRIRRMNVSATTTQYYDSYMYLCKTDTEITNDIVQRKYYRPDGKNYGEVIQEIKQNDDRTTYIRDERTGNILQSINPDGSSKSFWYDEKNNKIGELDEENNCTLYVYDERNMLLKKANYLLKGFPEINKSQISQYIIQHADQFIIESYIYADGSKYSCPYKSLLEQMIDGEGNIVTFTYDQFGNLLTTSKGYQTVDDLLTDQYGYYINYLDLNNLSLGIQTEEYVAFVNGNKSNCYTVGMEKQTTSPMGVMTTNYIDNHGLTYKTVLQDGENQEITRTVYDTLGRKLKEISAAAYAKNGCNALESTVSHRVDSSGTYYTYYNINFASSSPCIYATEYTYYDKRGPGYSEPKMITYPMVDGTRDVHQYVYERKNVIKETTPDGQVFEYEYDELNRRTETKVVFMNNYDNCPFPETFEKVSRTLSADNEYLEKTIANPSIVNGNASSVSNYYNYGNQIRLKERRNKSALEASQENMYNKNGTISKTRNASGNIIYYTYDSLNRVTEEWEAIDAFEGTTFFRFTKKEYYKNGNVKTEYVCTEPVKIMMDGNEKVLPSSGEYPALIKKDGTTTSQLDYIVKNYTYYHNGKIKQTTQNNGAITEYAYDADGNLSMQVVNGSKTTYENTYFGKPVYKYDYVSPNNMQLSDSDQYTIIDGVVVLITEYRYEYGNLVEVIKPNGSSINYTYDEMGRKVSTSQNGDFVNHAGDTVHGIYKVTQKLDWKNNLKEQAAEEVINGETTLISKMVYHPKEDKSWSESNNNYYYLFSQKVDTIAYDPENGVANTSTSLYYTDVYDRIILSVTPENYLPDGVVSFQTLYQENFSEDPKEMNRTEFEYDSFGRLIREIERFRDPNENNAWKKIVRASYQYDENNNIIEKTDAMGNSTKYIYNLANKIYLEKDPVSQENKYAYSKKYNYDALGRTISEINGAKHETQYTYDDQCNTVMQTNSVTNPDGTEALVEQYSKFDTNNNLIESYLGDPSRTFTYVYNERNQLIESHTPYDETAPESNSTIMYDSMGNVCVKKMGTERLETFTYDMFGNNTSVTISKQDGTDAITTSKAYDSRGNVRFETDGNQNTVEHKYDALGREIETNAVHATHFTYDKNGNMTAQTDWRGNIQSFLYDPLNRLIQKKDADGTTVEKLYYNDNGTQIKSVDALGNETIFAYDKNNRLISSTDALEHTSGRTYNRAGLVESQYDGNGNTTSFDYDELGRLLNVKQDVEDEEQLTSFTYDIYGNLLTQTNGEGHTTTFSYNVVNNVIAKIDHNGVGDPTKTESYKYDERGNMIEKTDRNGNTLTYVYDVHNRLRETKQGETILIGQTYDANGNKLTMQDESGTTTRTYDSLNRVVTKDVPGMGTSTFQYDITNGIGAGQIAEKAVDPKGNTTVKIYDKNNRLYGVKDAEQATPATYEYYANGAQKKITNPDGSSANFVYHANGTLAELTNKDAANSIIDRYTYLYDAAKNQIAKTETVNGVEKGTTNYTYDSLNRIKTVQEPSGKLTEYTYDKAGNRTAEQITENGLLSFTSYQYNAQERLINTVQTTADTTKTIKYLYDNNGNVLGKATEIEKQATVDPEEENLAIAGSNVEEEYGAIYEYNVLNQLVKAYQGNKVISNVYNGEGYRVSKTVNGKTCNYLYEYDKIVLETDGAGSQTARNVYGTSLISRAAGGDKFTYHFNGHGDVTSLTNGNGTVAASYDYDPFGKQIGVQNDSDEAAVNNPFRYAGYEMDDETELYYLKSRFYDAETARFMQEDTYRGDPKDPLSLNLYTYVSNNPMTYIDWFGFYGVSEYDPNNPYILIYTSDKPERYNDAENDYITGCQYSAADIAELLKLTGGNVNIVLSVRDLDYDMDKGDAASQAANIDPKLVADYNQIISMFVEAAGETGVIPQFFLGSPHLDTIPGSTNELYTDIINKYGDTVKKLLNDISYGGDTSMVAGIYFGKEDPVPLRNDVGNGTGDFAYYLFEKVSRTTHSMGKSLLWIPYFTNDTEFSNVAYISNYGYYTDETGNRRSYIDVLLLQPGYFYSEIGAYQDEAYFDKKMQDIFYSVLYQRGIVNGQEVRGETPDDFISTTRIGVQIEYDMGLITGRLNKDGDVTRHQSSLQKRLRFAEYINRYYPLVTGAVDGNKKPFGLHIGGPNEADFSNPYGPNRRVHGTNHPAYYTSIDKAADYDRIIDPEIIKESGNGVRYNEFYGAPAYSGNLIMDIMKGWLYDDWGYNAAGESPLLDFLNGR